MIVNSDVPGSSEVPAVRHQAAPRCATSATWASVSALRTSVGRPSTPASVTRVKGSRGRPGRPSSWLTRAVSWPAMNPPSRWRTSILRWRAACMAGAGSSSGPTARIARLAFRARARTSSPSSTRCGLRVSRTASLWLSGSPSMALPTTTGLRLAAATARTLVAVGKPAPPRPVSPLAVTACRSSLRLGWGRRPYSSTWRAASVPAASSRRRVVVGAMVVVMRLSFGDVWSSHGPRTTAPGATRWP